MNRRVAPIHLDETDRRIIDHLQGGFPLSGRPYADAAAGLGLDEDELLRRLRALFDNRVLTRFGPLYQIERMGGRFELCAMRVPQDRFDAVAEQVNAFSEVAHNYRREHDFNMWFVLAAESEDAVADARCRIEGVTGLPVFPFPKEREYFVEMRLPVHGGGAA